MEYKFAFLGIAICAAVFYYRAWIAPLIEQNKLKQKYQSAAEPYLVIQSCEMDKGFWARYQTEVSRFVDSGNKWALEQVPVIPFPFNSNFEFQWFDKTLEVSTVGLGQREFLAASIRQLDECTKIWQQKTGKEFGYNATFQATGQKAAQGDIWASAN